MGQALAQADPLEQARGPAGPLGRPDPRDAHRHLGVLERAELGQQVVELEDEADVAVAKRHELRVGQIPQRAVGDPDAAGVDRVEPAQHVQQRALADARGADDGDHLALLDRDVEVAQHATGAPAVS